MTGGGVGDRGGVDDGGRLASPDIIVSRDLTSVPKAARAHTQHTRGNRRRH